MTKKEITEKLKEDIKRNNMLVSFLHDDPKSYEIGYENGIKDAINKMYVILKESVKNGEI